MILDRVIVNDDAFFCVILLHYNLSLNEHAHRRKHTIKSASRIYEYILMLE